MPALFTSLAALYLTEEMMSQCLLVPPSVFDNSQWQSSLALPPQSGLNNSLAVMKDSLRPKLVRPLQNVICCDVVWCTQPKLWQKWAGQDTSYYPHNEYLVLPICLTQGSAPLTNPPTHIPSLPFMLIVSFSLALWPLYSYSSLTFAIIVCQGNC